MEKILNRKKLRLEDFDYSSNGAYFITICTKNRENFFGEIVNDKMVLNKAGGIIEKCWQEIPRHYPNVRLDKFCVMPNHFHGILFLEKENLMRNENIRSLQTDWNGAKSGTISAIIRGFKIGVTKFARKNGMEKFQWQRSFHDRIIRDEEELKNITEYIKMNPENWEKDEEFMKL